MREYRIEAVPQMEDLMPLLKEALAAGRSVRFSPTGFSMLPMLRQGIDSVELSPISGRLKKYDLPLYQRESGKYILHRIVAAEDTYSCMGDNQFVVENGVRQDQLIAVVTAFYRGERRYSIESPIYRLYCRFWHCSRPVRHLWKRGKNWLARHLTGKAGQ